MLTTTAEAIVSGKTALEANQAGATAAQSRLGNIGTGDIDVSKGGLPWGALTSMTPPPPPTIIWKSYVAPPKEFYASTVKLEPNQRKGLQTVQFPSLTPAQIFVASQYPVDVYFASDIFNYSTTGNFPQYSELAVLGGSATRALSIPTSGPYLAAQNLVSGSNTVRIKLRRQPTVDGFHLQQEPFPAVATRLQAGKRFVQRVTVGSTYRTFIDGASSGATFYVLAASEISRFLAGGQFSTISHHNCGKSADAPYLCELTLTPGDYAVAFANDTSEPQGLVLAGWSYVPN